jgi:hypothetical protein
MFNLSPAAFVRKKFRSDKYLGSFAGDEPRNYCMSSCKASFFFLVICAVGLWVLQPLMIYCTSPVAIPMCAFLGSEKSTVEYLMWRFLLATFPFHMNRWMHLYLSFLPTTFHFAHVTRYLTKPSCSGSSHRSLSFKL